MIRKFLLLIFVFFCFVFTVSPVHAQNEPVVLHLFWASGCPHCAKEKVFLKSLEQKYPRLEIKDYEITGNRGNLELLQKAGKELSADVSGVPFTVIGKEYVAGYYSDETTGKEIEDAVKCAIEQGCVDIVGNLKKNTSGEVRPKHPIESLKLPLFGEIKVKNLSLPVITLIIGLLDGFNPCAMWVLLFLISLLLGMKDKKRMWILGTAFIAASGFVYFLFLSAWLNLFLFLGFIVWVRIAVGLVALGMGAYNLRDYLSNKAESCKVTVGNKRQKIFEKLKQITQRKEFLLALGGIIILAFAVNLVELICSAGFPAIYTQILSLSNLAPWQYYSYLILYIFFFMLDDMIVFVIAMLTLQAVGMQSKYSRFSHLIGGILMLIIGILMLFKPEWLMFG